MAKGQANRVNKGMNRESRKIRSESDRFMDTIWGQVPGAQNRAGSIWDRVFKGYGDILDDPNFGAGGGNFGEYENMFKEFARTGGLTPENIERIRGKGVFDEFAKTGGYSTDDIANIRSRGSATIPAFYTALKNRLDQQNKISGGSASYGASESRMARDQFREGQRAALDTEIGIKDKVNEGRRWGSSSLSGAEQMLAQLLSGNKLAGMEGGLRAAGMGDAAAERGGRNRLAALEGLRGLRTDVPGEEFGLYDFLLKGAGQRGQLEGANLDRRAAYNPNISGFDRFQQILGTLGPLAASFMAPGAGQVAGGIQRLRNGRNYGYLSGGR